jgi:hypothetical protein
MLNRVLCALCVALAVGLSGCVSEQAIGRYFENRRQDLTDVAHVDFSMANAGALAYVGPMALGGSMYTHPQTAGKPSHTLQLGLGSVRFVGREGFASGLLWFITKWSPDQTVHGPRGRKKLPSGASVGAHLGFVFGVAAEVDVVEAIDFVVGLVGFDLMEDDAAQPAPTPAGATEQAPPAPGDNARAAASDDTASNALHGAPRSDGPSTPSGPRTGARPDGAVSPDDWAAERLPENGSTRTAWGEF